MATETSFDYYYGDESSQFSFYRIPRQLITGDRFKRLSTDARSNPLCRRMFPDFRFSEVKTSENQKSRFPKNRSQDFRFPEVQTSENRTQVILNQIKLR